MNISPRRFRRGDTSPERPGKVFLRYGKLRSGDWREEWVTPEKLEEFKTIQYAKADEWRKTEDGKKSQRASGKKQRDSGYAATYMAQYRRKWEAVPKNRIAKNYRSRMGIALKHAGVKKKSKTEETLGCSFEYFRQWIERQFEPGMTMENYGSVWVVDHIIPVAAFNMFDEEEVRRCFHWSNCQPLFKKDNHEKNDKIPGTAGNGRFTKKTIPLDQRIA